MSKEGEARNLPTYNLQSQNFQFNKNSPNSKSNRAERSSIKKTYGHPGVGPTRQKGVRRELIIYLFINYLFIK